MKITTTTDLNYLHIVGPIWQGQLCGSRLDLSLADVAKIGEPTRENISAWLAKSGRTGDFQSVKDFSGIVGESTVEFLDDSMSDYCGGEM